MRRASQLRGARGRCRGPHPGRLGRLVKRVPFELVCLLLAQEGIAVNARTVRNWTLRGHITRTSEGYDLREILSYLDLRKARDTRSEAA